MIRSPEELTNPIKSAVNRRAVVFSHILLAATISIHTLLYPKAPQYQRITAVVLGVVIIALIFLRFFDFARINSRPRAYLVVYTILVFVGYAFISDASTPYTAGVFLLVFLYNLYYGSKGVVYVIGFFIFTNIVKYFYLLNTSGLSYADRQNIIVAVAVFVAIGSLFINIQKVFDWDRAQLRDKIKESVIEQKRLRALVNNMTESVLVLDKEGVIRLYNAAALALFNTNNSLSDKPLDGFAKFEDEKGKIITTTDLLPKDTKPIIRSDIIMRYSHEDTAALSLVITPIRSTFGEEEEASFVMTMRDITHEKSLEEERDEFISVISHELRTPVTVAEAGVSNALLLAEKLDASDKAEKMKQSLKTAHDQAVYLANMLNDLTTFARAEKGTLDLNLEEFDPRELLERLKEDYRGAVQAKNMKLTAEYDPSTPLRMASNRLYIREILQNFVTNAIKYSDKGTVTLSARAKDRGVLFSVTDQGIGISTSDQKKIFEKFFRAEDYRTRSTNGTGLGLYITKKLARILDASFEVQSQVGVGSTFSLYVPDMSSALAIKKAAEAAPAPPAHHQLPGVHSSPPVIASPTAAPLPAAVTPITVTVQQPDGPNPTNVPLQKQG